MVVHDSFAVEKNRERTGGEEKMWKRVEVPGDVCDSFPVCADKKTALLVPFNFCGIPEQDYERARVVIFPVSYDRTTSYRAGARDGALAMIHASRQLDEPWGSDQWHPAVEDRFFYTPEGELRLQGCSTREQLDSLRRAVWHYAVEKGKTPFLFGGDHSISYAAIAALFQVNQDFSILHLDAHPDLCDELDGDPYSHGCVMRRSFELGPRVSLTSVGIRSVDRDTAAFIQQQRRFSVPEKSLHIYHAEQCIPEVPIAEIIGTLKSNVYITVDLDVMDPSEMPSVGTPQPGGMRWREVTRFIEEVILRRKVIGMDIVELAPSRDNIAPDVAAAKLAWRMIEVLYFKERRGV